VRFVPSALLAIVAAGFGWLFVTRYWLYRDCIEAAASSCITPDGDNLIAGGALWIVPGVIFALLALLMLLRRR
jgi:hypothetical protein